MRKTSKQRMRGKGHTVVAGDAGSQLRSSPDAAVEDEQLLRLGPRPLHALCKHSGWSVKRGNQRTQRHVHCFGDRAKERDLIMPSHVD